MHRDVDPRSPAITAGAAALAAVVAVGSDVVAGGRPLHTMSLGLIGVIVALLRIRLAGRHRGLFAAMTASFVAQPVLDAATKVLGFSVPAGSAGHTVQETSLSILPVVVAAAIVVAVACAEQLLDMVDVRRTVVRWLRMSDLVVARRSAGAPIGAVRATPAQRRVPLIPRHRRGPPAAAPVLAV
ncbi:hypothetical protein GCM10017691_20600 [Pseudonocardia petroleophila]